MLAEDNIEVEPNHVYQLPPKKEMIIRGRRLLLSDKERMHGLRFRLTNSFDPWPRMLGPTLSALFFREVAATDLETSEKSNEWAGQVFGFSVHAWRLDDIAVLE